jgi:proteasome lid subunit RPN8/RPN11
MRAGLLSISEGSSRRTVANLKISHRQSFFLLFGRQEKVQRKIVISRKAADGIITWSKTHHPNEAILVLQGRTTKDQIIIDGLVIPPFAESGPFYSGFALHDLPYTIPHVGTAHSHPGSSNAPSLEDLHYFTGFVSIIISHPYEDETMAAYDRNGNKLEIKIVDSV